MDITILPYYRLPEYIRENENLRQTLLQSGGIMKYVAEHIDDPFDDNTLSIFVQYQNYVAENYRRANLYNPNRQSWSVDVLRQRALNGSNHLWSELHSRRDLMRSLRTYMDVPLEAKSMVDDFNLKYLEYAWKEDLRRRRADIETDLGIYKYVMEQFERYNGLAYRSIDKSLACRSIDIALKKHHGFPPTEIDNFDSLNIEMFHFYYFWPTIIDRLQSGLEDLLQGKNTKECRAEAMSMLMRVKWFSQHIYNDEVEDVLNDSFTLEDKRWLRNILEHYDRDRFSEEELSYFYFGKLFADIGRIWEEQMRCNYGIDLSELEKEANTFVNTEPLFRNITWEEKKQCFKSTVLHVMKMKKDQGGFLFENNTQWIAVYRFAVDIGIMYDKDDPNASKDKTTPQYTTFAHFAHELELDLTPPTRLPFTLNSIKSLNNKVTYARYRTPYPWSQEGLEKGSESLKLYIELQDIYYRLQEAYNFFVEGKSHTLI